MAGRPYCAHSRLVAWRRLPATTGVDAARRGQRLGQHRSHPCYNSAFTFGPRQRDGCAVLQEEESCVFLRVGRKQDLPLLHAPTTRWLAIRQVRQSASFPTGLGLSPRPARTCARPAHDPLSFNIVMLGSNQVMRPPGETGVMGRIIPAMPNMWSGAGTTCV